jgi:hypothetical protein
MLLLHFYLLSAIFAHISVTRHWGIIMPHGFTNTFEIAGERQVVAGQPVEPPVQGFRFGRMFHGLPPFRPTDASLQALGATMTATPERADSDIPAGYTYLGQFIDHDITLDTTEGAPEDAVPLVDDFTADAIKQGRSPSLDLDSLYGKPGEARADLVDGDGVHMRLGITTATPDFPVPADMAIAGSDVPRLPSGPDRGQAVIGDHRNDENLIIQQLHLAFLKFHNKVADQLATSGPRSPLALFAQTREFVTRHYQWIVLNDFVRRVVSDAIFADVLGVKDLARATQVTLNPKIFPIIGSQTPPMPLEFSAAAYRFGHSMVRDAYSWNKIFGSGTSFRLFFNFTHLSGGIGRPTGVDPDRERDFGRSRGLATFPSNWIADWRRMFPLEAVRGFPAFLRGDDEMGGQIPLNPAKAIDTQLASQLGILPFKAGNLAARNMIRGSRNGLPCGQDVAAAIVAKGDASAAPLTPAEIVHSLDPRTLAVVREHEFDIKTPLWFYILKEAELRGNEGEHLGPVGSRIVMETFVALIRASVTSIFNADPATAGALNVFSPTRDSTLRTPGGEAITSMAHLLAFVDDVNPLGS